MAHRIPEEVTVKGAAEIVSAFAHRWSEQFPKPGVTVRLPFTVRQVRIAIENGHAQYTRAAEVNGQTSYLDAVEVSMLVLCWLLGFWYAGQQGERVAWAAAKYCGGAIREGLSVPSKRLALQVIDGRASVVPESAVSATEFVPLAVLREKIDEIIASQGEWARAFDIAVLRLLAPRVSVRAPRRAVSA